MKTRVTVRYWIEAGVQLYGVEVWKDAYKLPSYFVSMHGESKDIDVPAGWHAWPDGYRAVRFQTVDQEKALRIARELSEGKTPNIDAAIAEFVDGVQFSVVE